MPYRPEILSEADYRTRSDSLPVNFYDYPILAEGDSWFSFGGSPKANLLSELSLERPSLILNFANPGDQIRKMTKLGHRTFFHLLLKEPSRFWSVLLLSGGGNDVIADLQDILRAPAAGASVADPASYINPVAFADTLRSVQEGYNRISDLRRGTAHERMPIIAHTYDYAMPRNAPSRILGRKFGPWLRPRLAAVGVPSGMEPMVADALFTLLAETILDLSRPGSSTQLPNFHVVDTRGTLIPADPKSTGKSNDWLNEIHPTREGFEKIAIGRLNGAIDRILRQAF